MIPDWLRPPALQKLLARLPEHEKTMVRELCDTFDAEVVEVLTFKPFGGLSEGAQCGAGVAQMGERPPCKREAPGSIPGSGSVAANPRIAPSESPREQEQLRL